MRIRPASPLHLPAGRPGTARGVLCRRSTLIAGRSATNRSWETGYPSRHGALPVLNPRALEQPSLKLTVFQVRLFGILKPESAIFRVLAVSLNGDPLPPEFFCYSPRGVR